MIRPEKGFVHRTLRRAGDLFRLRNLDMRRKIVIYYSILLLIPLLLLYYFAMDVYVQNRENDALSSNLKVSQIAMNNIDNYVQQIQELTKQPLYDSNVLVALVNSSERTAQASQKDNYIPRSIPETNNAITNMANRILLFNRYIHSVIVLDANGNYAYRIIDNSLTKPYNAKAEPWYAQCVRLNGKPLLVNTFDFMDYIMGDYYIDRKALNVFSVARAIKETNSNRRVGLIMINIHMDYLADICASVRSGGGERVLVLDGAGNICYDTAGRNIGGSIASEAFDLPELRTVDLSREVNRIEAGGDRVVLSVASRDSGWRLVRLLPEAGLYGGVRELRNMLTAILLAFVTVAMLISISISYSVTKPLSKLIRTMQSVNRGDFSQRFKVKYNDEVGQLGRSFNTMMDSIDNLVNTVHVSQLREREAELHALQAQINPHFIYNTLESIRQQAKAEGNEGTAQMVFALGKLLRYSIRIQNQIVTVREEVAHLNNYLFLLNYRFDGKYSLEIDIEERLYGMRVIKLIFQPIVENSILHALEAAVGRGFIRLTGACRDGRAVFTVEDNGQGMAPEELERLRERIAGGAPAEHTGGVGLQNIHERIRLKYGEDYGVAVESREGRGTTVTVTLPCPPDAALGEAGQGAC